MQKVVMDRLMSQEDRDILAKDIVNEVIKKKFPDIVDSAMQDPIL